MSTPASNPPQVLWSAPPQERAGTALLIALHGRGATEQDFAGLAAMLPDGLTVASVRGPIPEGNGYAWFANRGIGRPQPESLREHTATVTAWLDSVADQHPKRALFGFSGGCAMAGSVLLTDPSRVDAAVLLSGTLPWDVGLDDAPGVLAGVPVFYGRSDDDPVIPLDLITRTRDWLRGPSGATLTEPAYTGFGHSISTGELRDISHFLARSLDL
jgi:phospholipase/carboxylesterase